MIADLSYIQLHEANVMAQSSLTGLLHDTHANSWHTYDDSYNICMYIVAGDACLSLLIFCGSIWFTQVLLKFNIEQDLKTPLWVASFYGKEEVAKLFLDQGAKIDAKSKVFAFKKVLLILRHRHA